MIAAPRMGSHSASSEPSAPTKENSVFLAGFRWQVTMFGVGVGGVVEMQQDGL